MKRQTGKGHLARRLLCAALVLACAGVGFAAPNPFGKTVQMEGFRPILHHLAAPRQAIDLGGEWEVCALSCRKEAYTNAQGKADYRLVEPPFETTATCAWQLVRVPETRVDARENLNFYWRKAFELPKTLEKGGHVALCFERIGESYELYVNGRKVRSHAATFSWPQRIDISEFVQRGSNTVVVMTRQDGVRRPWSDSPVWEDNAETGITRPVHVEFTGGVFVKELAHGCRLVPGKDGREGKVLDVRILVRNDRAESVEAVLTGNAAGYWSNFSEVKVALGPRSEKWVTFSHPCDGVPFWSPDKPTLVKMNVRVSVGGKVTDALSQRYGFREFKAVGHRFYLNGRPYMNKRATWNGDGGKRCTDKESFFRQFARFRERGVHSFRVFGGDVPRMCEAADEYGMLITPVAHAGCGAAWRTDRFWPLYEGQLCEMARALRHHPSIIYWNVSNEFGSIYGGDEGGPREKQTTARQVAAARKMLAVDPTRLWEACGEVELGYPIKGNDGPAPIRSYHYPIGYSDDGNELPNAAYWYANGKVPWQGIVTKTKPASFSEDLYHGSYDCPLGFTKWFGEDIFSFERFQKMSIDFVRLVYGGLCYSGIGTWEPWAVGMQEDCGSFRKYGTPTPDFLITLLEFPMNLWAGERAERTVNVYFEGFGTQRVRLWREDFAADAGGSLVSCGAPRDVSGLFEARPGSRFWKNDEVVPPATLGDGAVYRVAYTLKDMAGTNELARASYDFHVFRRETVKALWPFFTSVDDLKGTDRILVAKSLTETEGLALERWVRAGGTALMFEIPEGGWSPYVIAYRRGQTRIYRRRTESFTGIDDDMMKSWQPDGYLGRSGVPKCEEDVECYFDAGRKEGLSAAVVFRLYRGKGSYLACQMPLLEVVDREPAAAFFLKALYAEFSRAAVRPSGTVAIDDGRCPATNRVVRSMFKSCGLAVANDSGARNQLLVIDCSHGIDSRMAERANAALAKGRRVWLLEVPADADCDILASYGLALAQPPRLLTTVPWNGVICQRDNGVRWVNRAADPGLLDGVSDDDLFWWNANGLWGYYRGLDIGRHPMCWMNSGEWKNRPTMSGATAILERIQGSARQPAFRTEPAAWAEMDVGEGRLVVSTLRMAANAASAHTRIGRVLRTALLNVGVRTSADAKVRKFQPLDISKAMNRNLWHDPLTRQKDGTYKPEAWFGREDNDLRWFPVNLCGWSLQARNNCPKEPFPTEPMVLGGVPFKLVDPLENGNKACLVLMSNETARVTFEKPVRADRFDFLGAHSGFIPSCNLTIDFGDDREPFVASLGRQIGTCRWAEILTDGVCAVSFQTQQDATASLYRFTVPNPKPQEPVKTIEFRLNCPKGGAAILAVTGETDAF